jgi:hypothetical protein
MIFNNFDIFSISLSSLLYTLITLSISLDLFVTKLDQLLPAVQMFSNDHV